MEILNAILKTVEAERLKAYARQRGLVNLSTDETKEYKKLGRTIVFEQPADAVNPWSRDSVSHG